MAEFDLRGFLCCGKFQVNDYVIHVERVTEGVKIKIVEGDGTVQEATIRDGEPGMTDDEIAKIKNLYDTMARANGDWTEAEEERARAEAARKIAEDGPQVKSEPETDEEKMQYRSGLYSLMLALYNRIYPKIDEDLANLEENRIKAEEAAEKAEQAAAHAEATTFGDWATKLFHYDGDEIAFDASLYPGTKAGQEMESIASSETISIAMNATGYVTDSSKTIRLKIPIRKSLLNITGITCESFVVSLGGASKYFSHSDRKNQITRIVIDKVQNCLHLTLKRPGGEAYGFTNHEAITARVGSVSEENPAVHFTLTGMPAPVYDESALSDGGDE